ncbi:acyl carrier protein [Buchnera aphidicola]|uniref:acyl carrier protein n=1 Tax=Buchnera aphidicola TaxID=9 RepID=UPI003463A158
MNTIKKRTKKIISKILEINILNLKENTNLKDDLKIDSLDIIEIVMTIEEEFNIEISDTDIEKFVYLKDIIECIHKLKQHI